MNIDSDVAETIERNAEGSTLPADRREALGRVVRETWVDWAKAQPDVAAHPSWLVPWDALPERDREVDRLIGDAVARAMVPTVVSRLVEAERELDEAHDALATERSRADAAEKAVVVSSGLAATAENALVEARADIAAQRKARDVAPCVTHIWREVGTDGVAGVLCGETRTPIFGRDAAARQTPEPHDCRLCVALADVTRLRNVIANAHDSLVDGRQSGDSSGVADVALTLGAALRGGDK